MADMQTDDEQHYTPQECNPTYMNVHVGGWNTIAYEMTNIDRGGYDEFNNTIGFIE